MGYDVTASGEQNSYFTANAVDGNLDTFWQSTKDYKKPWIQFDMKASYSVEKVKLTESQKQPFMSLRFLRFTSIQCKARTV